MKLMFVTDIHGSYEYAEKVVAMYKAEQADYLILLGDILYHGPRNPLPNTYDPMKVANLLNGMKDKIIAVRGNCDSEVDQMVLEFPITADYNVIPLHDRKIIASHGHIYHPEKLPASLTSGDIFIFGHIHIPVLTQVEGVYIINPGSISLPKENNPHTYGILEDNVFNIKTLDNQIYQSLTLA